MSFGRFLATGAARIAVCCKTAAYGGEFVVKDQMRVIICGAIDFNDWEKTLSALDYWHKRLDFTLLIHGDREGAEELAVRWAKLRRIATAAESVPEDERKRLGGDLSQVTNRRMIDRYKPERVIAFSGGPETRDMINQARAARIRVIEVA